MEKQKYIVIRVSSGKESLEREVNAKINEGYQPVGSASYDWFGGVYVQGMILSPIVVKSHL